ncbi:MAG: PTS transporter subunit EIIC [Culicoidibacterales bacterium]
MGKYTDVAKQLLVAIGGKENIVEMIHCVTRLRITVADSSLIQQTVIDELECVKGSQFQSGQFQIIIGPAVKDIYEEMITLDNSCESQPQAKQKLTRKWYETMVTTLSEILIPVLPLVIAGGLIIGAESILTEVLVMNNTTLANSFPILEFTSSLLALLSQTIFLFLPVIVAFGATKYFGGTPMLGAIVAISMILPYLTKNESNHGNYQFLQTYSYAGQVLPAIAIGFCIAHIEKFFDKYVPDLLKVPVVPTISLISTAIIVYLIVGPITQGIGFAIGAIFRLLFTSSFRFVFGFLFGFSYAPLTLTGFHHLFLFVDLQLISTGGTMIWPMIALSNIAQGSAAFAMYVVYQKNKKQKKAAIDAAKAALIGGVTEPAMFGVNLPIRSAFYCALIGSGISSGCLTLWQIKANAIGIGGLAAILSIPPTMWPSYLVVILIALIVPFSLTLIIANVKKTRVDAKGE